MKLGWQARLALLVAFAAGIAAVWYFAGSSLRSADDVASRLRELAARPLGFLFVPLAFAAGTVLFVPVNALIAGVALVFSPLECFCFAFSGALLGACATYWVGRALGASAAERLRGPRVERFIAMVKQNPFRASVILRLVPVGSFGASNMLAGSLRVPFAGYFWGNVVGLTPGIAFFAFLKGQLPKVLGDPSPANLALLAGGVLALVALFIVLRRWAKGRA